MLAIVFGLQYFFEHLYPQNKKLNDWKNERFNLSIGLLNVVLNFVPASALVYLLGFIEQNRIGLLMRFSLPSWLEILLTILVLDCWMYAWHRINHTVPFFWQFHRFHHEDQRMNSTTAVRFHIAELLLSLPGKAAVYLLFGLRFTPVIVYETLFFTAIVFHHSNIRISAAADGLYRILFASPVMHRIHHSCRKEERNANYGAVFSFWDRLFRSWVKAPKGEIVFGVEEKQ